MTTPPLPSPLSDDRLNRVANGLHSAAIHLLRRARTADAETGLTPERLSLLSILCYAGPRRVGELAQAEMVSAPAISRILNGLEQSGLARRERHATDRRRVLVRATPKARRLMDTARRKRLEHIAEELVMLGQEDLETLERAVAVLESLGRNRSR